MDKVVDGKVNAVVGEFKSGEIRVTTSNNDSTLISSIILDTAGAEKLITIMQAAILESRKQLNKVTEPPGALIWKHNWKSYAPIDSLLVELQTSINMDIEVRSKYAFARGFLYREHEYWKVTSAGSRKHRAVLMTFKAENVAQIRIYKNDICIYLKSY